MWTQSFPCGHGRPDPRPVAEPHREAVWALFLYGGGVIGASLEGLSSPAGPQTGNFAPMIPKGFAEIAATGDIAGDVGRWFRRRSTVARSERIQAPTLIVQGAIDTLFPLEDGFENFRNVLPQAHRPSWWPTATGTRSPDAPIPGVIRATPMDPRAGCRCGKFDRKHRA